MSPSANRTATPAGVSRNARLASLGSGGWLRLESPADFVGIRTANEHAVLVLDRAGWHRARKLVVPSNVTLVWLPPYSPQLNPVERVWLFLRERHLSHRLLNTYTAIVDALCQAWNTLTAERLHRDR